MDHGSRNKMGDTKQNYLEALSYIPNRTLSRTCHKSTYSSLPDAYNCKVKLTLTSDDRTSVCCLPTEVIPYKHIQHIPQPDLLHNNEEIYKQVLNSKLKEESKHLEPRLMMEQPGKVFFTTKHR